MLDGLLGLPGPLLVTGHTGFKGSWIMLLLEKLGVQAVGISLPAEPDSLYTQLNLDKTFPEYFVDITNKEKFQEVVKEVKPSAIIHLAAQSLVLESYRNPYRTFSSNVLGTANLCEISRELPDIKAVMIATTDKVYENKNKGLKFAESDPLRGSDPYSSSKVATESTINIWQQVYENDGGPSLISVRAGNVIGGGDLAKNRLLPDIIRKIYEGKKLEIRNPDSTRPWQHVLDPLFGYLMLLSTTISSKSRSFESFNFATDEESKSVAWAIEVIETLLNQKLDYSVIGAKEKESKFLDLDSSKAFKEIGWRAKWTQQEAIEKTFFWWRDVNTRKYDPRNRCFMDIEEYLAKAFR